ncbi:MAG: hypothetical protein NC489_29685 [Ruminococcus flavefaciens]|nr:hypothetical protein [Ruminococcus flavefaciens]
MIIKVKGCKLLIYALIAALILPIGISNHTVYAETTGTETDAEDVITPSVIVSSYEELAQAIEDAEDGDIIGIDRIISICHDVDYLGIADKHFTILKMADNAYFEVSQSVRLTVRNLTFDGNRDNYNRTNTNPMFCINSDVVFQDVVIENCYSRTAGGGLCINNGIVNINDCTFINNYTSSQGGHIILYNTATANIRNTTLTKGESEQDGAAININTMTATVNLIHSKVYNNISKDYGGGISNTGKLFVQNSIIYGNVAKYGADFANKILAKFQIESIEKLIEIYKSVNILPKSWITDYDGDDMMPPSMIDLLQAYALVKLDYEEIPEENNPDGNSGNGMDTEDFSGNDDGLQNENEDKKDELDSANDSLGNEEANGNDNDSEQPEEESNKENDNKNDTAADNNVEDTKVENNAKDDIASSSGNTGNPNIEQEKPEGGTAADSDSKTENSSTEDKENQDKQENQGIVGNDENNPTDSSSDLDNKDFENSNSNTPDIPAENDNQTNSSIIGQPITSNENSESDSKSEVNKQPGSTANNENQGDVSAEGIGNSSDNNISNQPNNKPVVDNGSNIVNSNLSGDTNSGSGSGTGNTNSNAGTNTPQSGENVLPRPEDNKDSDSSDKEGTAAITDSSQTAASDSGNDNSDKKATVTKKKAIKKLSLTAKKGKKKITGKTIKKATVKVKIGKTTYKVKSNAKGKFTIKLKGKTGLKKGQKIKITILKIGYKTKHKTYKVK